MKTRFSAAATIPLALFAPLGTFGPAARAQQPGQQPGTATAAKPAVADVTARLPVREVTVFKDGHAVLIHQGTLPLDPADGSVTLDTLPAPVLGTFWPFSADKNVRLRSAVAGRRRVSVERAAVSLRDLLAANVGKAVLVTEAGGPYGGTANKTYEATVLSLPVRTPEEIEAAADPRNRPPVYDPNAANRYDPYTPGGGFDNSSGRLGLVLLRTAEGVRAVDVSRILDITFKDVAPAQKIAASEWRARLTLFLEPVPPATARPASAAVGLMYLQKGLRWIPAYKVTLDGKQTAQVSLQATLLNEITDLNNVTASLVIGVPTFIFRDTPDPSGLLDVLARLGPFFEAGSRDAVNNAIAGQGGGFGGGGVSAGGGFGLGAGQRGRGGDGQSALAADVADAGRSEDLFVFTLKNVTLAKGQRAVLPVAAYSLPYRDLYTLDLPVGAVLGPEAAFSPGGNLLEREQARIARMNNAERVIHKIRLVNNGPHPLTTAPALLVEGDTAGGGERVLAQNLLPYAPAGGTADLTLTTAVDVTYDLSESETKRTPNVFSISGDRNYTRVDSVGTLRVTNRTAGPIVLEVSRHVLGEVDTVGQNGARQKVTPGGRGGDAATPGRPTYTYYEGIGYVMRVNGPTRLFWRRTLAANETVDLTYAWHYFAPQ